MTEHPSRIILTYGTFDIFHVGHVRLLQRARALGDYLIAACSTDEFNDKKGKRSVFSFEDRCEILASCRYVDKVIPETDWSQKRNDVIKYNVNKFVMGDDWKGKFDELSDITEVVYLPRTENISTTQIRHTVRNNRAFG